MKATKFLLILSAVLAASAAPFWSASASAQQIKIGVVDTQQALTSSNAGKSAIEEMKRKQREAQAQISPLTEQIKKLQEEYQSKRFVLSEEALRDMQSKMLELRNTLEARSQELRGKLEIDENRLMAPLQEKLRKTIEAIGKEQGFALIIARGSAIYTRETLDITDLVVARFNKS